MSIELLLGRTATLEVARIIAHGALLTSPELEQAEEGPILLPRRELPEALEEGDPLEVFLYLDSEDRPVATVKSPQITLGEVRFLRVRELTRIGAFVDWGLQKDLLVPFAEQTSELAAGDIHPFGLIVDRSGRLAGTMRIRELLKTGGRFVPDEWVLGEAWRYEAGIGVFCILEGRYVGLVPESEPHALRRGQRAEFRVSHVMEDGKVELSLRGHAHEELDRDAARIYGELARDPRLELSDAASPEQIRELFGISKKAFKRAVGTLLRRQQLAYDERGRLVIADGDSTR